MRVIVTGGNSGGGKATAGELAVAGHDVVIACRMLTKAHEAAAAMNGNVEVAELDLSHALARMHFDDLDAPSSPQPAAARPRTRQIPE